MKRRFLSVLMTLSLCLTLLPTSVWATTDGTHTHCVCGGSCTELDDDIHDCSDYTDVEWTEITSLGGISGAGYYYLGSDITQGYSSKTINADVHICLNGHKIICNAYDSSWAFFISSGCSLTITDCAGGGQILPTSTDEYYEDKGCIASSGGSFTMYGGKISGFNNTDAAGGAVHLYSSGNVMNMYGGEISGNEAHSGGGVSCSTLNMYGGEITDNKAHGGSSSGTGGGVSCSTLNMHGGKITDNTCGATGNTTYNGGGVHTYSINMTGGEISGNRAYGGGGGIYFQGNSQSIGSISGGEISDNTAIEGGGVYGDENLTVKNGTSITGNTAVYGGGVYVSNNFAMTGGEIKENTAEADGDGKGGYGGGVYVYSTQYGPSISGVEITKNEAVRGGGIYYCYNTNNTNDAGLPLSDSTITDNTAGEIGGGIYCERTVYGNQNTCLVLSGTVTVTDNEADGSVDNLYLHSYKEDGYNFYYYSKLKIDSLDDESEIGISTGLKPTDAANPVPISNSTGSGYEDCFFSDISDYSILSGDDGLMLSILSVDSVELTEPDDTAITVPGIDDDDAVSEAPTVKVKDANGDVIASASVTWSVVSVNGDDEITDLDDFNGITFDPETGVITVKTSALSGAESSTCTITIQAESGGKASNTVTYTVTREKGEPYSITIGDDSSVSVPRINAYGANATDSSQYAATVRDQYGADITDECEIDWSISDHSDGITIGDSGNVRLDEDTDGKLIFDNTVPAGSTVTLTAEVSGVSPATKTVTFTRETSPASFIRIIKDGQDVTGKDVTGKTDTIYVPGNGKNDVIVTYSATMYDQYGDEMEEETASWSIGDITNAPSGVSLLSEDTLEITVPSSAGAGTLTATASSGNGSADITVMVKLRDTVNISVSGNGTEDGTTTTYGTNITLTADIPDNAADGTIEWSYDDEEFASVSETDGSITLKPLKAGRQFAVTAAYEGETVFGSASASINVLPKPLTVIPGTYSVSREYNGSVAPGTASGKLEVDGIVEGDDVEVVASPPSYSDPNVGAQTQIEVALALNGSDKDNYTLESVTLSVPCSITPATPVITTTPSATVSFGDIVSSSHLSGGAASVDGSFQWASSVTDYGDVGFKTLAAIFVPNDETNYSRVENITINTTVNRLRYSHDAQTDTIDHIYSDKGLKTYTPDVVLPENMGTLAWFMSVDDKNGVLSDCSIDEDTGSVSYTLRSHGRSDAGAKAVLSITVSSANYTDIVLTLTISIVDKDKAGVSVAGLPESVTYGDSFTLTASALNTGEGAGSWVWSCEADEIELFADGSSASVKALSATDSPITITAAYESDTTIGSADASFTIEPAPIIIAAVDQSIRSGTAVPDLSMPVENTHYTVSGLLGDDTLDKAGISFSMSYQRNGEDVTPSAVGTYKIVFTDSSNTDNYSVTYVDGTLTIRSRSTGSGNPLYPVAAPGGIEGGTVSVTPQNAAEGTTVTVTVTPDSGCALDSLTVLDKNGDEIEITDNGDGTYSFEMPTGKVTIEATFAKNETASGMFEDVSADKYYYDAVLWAVENDITDGVGGSFFGPELSCTRAQVVTFLWRAAGSPEPESSTIPFEDVPADAYYRKAVLWAVENGITTGVNGISFCPDTVCARAQIVAFLFRYAVFQGMEAITLQELVSGYTDAAQVPGYALSAFNWAIAQGITQGYNGELMPNSSCTRAQLVTMLYRLLG